jgi:hypothetical protein
VNKIRISKIRMNRTRWEFLITLIGLGSLIFAIAKSRAIDFEQYQQYRNTIVQLQQKESNFIQIILSSRYELYVSYDPLVNNLNVQKEIQQQLANIPDFLNDREKQEIQTLLKERETLLSQKESLSEWFKSQNSLLKNSLRYLPLLASQLEAQVSRDTEETSRENSNSLTNLRIIFNDLLRNLLLYNITNNEDIAPVIEQQIERLSQLREQEQISDREFPIQLAISHANIILTQKPQVEELTAQLLISSPQKTQDLANLYRISYQKARQTIGVYRFLRSGLFISLLVWLNYLFLRRFYWARKNSASQPENIVSQEPQDIKSPELSEQKRVVENSIKSGNSQSTVDRGNSELIADVSSEKNNEQDNICQPSQSTNEQDEFWEDFQSVALLEAEEERQLETLQVRGSTDLVETEERKSIATLPLSPTNSKNLQFWLQTVNHRTSSLAIALHKYIQQKPCKIWLDRLRHLSRDRFAKFKRKRTKIR